MRIRLISFFILALIIGFVIGYWLLPYFNTLASQKAVSEKVKTLYELANPGTKVTVESINEMDGIYHVVLKAQSVTGTNYREVFVTKDGKLLTEGVIYVENSTRSIKAFKDFVNCLYDKGVRIYGVLNRTQNPQGAVATYLQLNLLGRYSGKLFVDCDGLNVVNCIKANVTQVPSIVYNGKVYSGVRTTTFLEELTGCKIPL